MRLFTPFTIPKKGNCDLCRIEKRSNSWEPLLDKFLKLYRQKFGFVSDWSVILIDDLLLEEQTQENFLFEGLIALIFTQSV